VSRSAADRLAATGERDRGARPERAATAPGGPADAGRAAFLVWAAGELALGRPGDAMALLAMLAVLLVVRWLALPPLLDAANLVAWTLQALGQVAGFWSKLPWWDTLVHFVLPAVLGPTALYTLVRLAVLPDLLADRRPRRRLGVALVAFLIAAGFGAGYEIYEWLSDRYTTTTYQPSNDDTMTDMTANLLGGLLGAVVLAVAGARASGDPWRS
jgi:hypothetical protein